MRWYEDGKRRAQDEHLHRFHRRRRASDRARATPRRGRIVAQGGSAGGMLMGAVANMRARPLRRHHRRGAVRRRAEHDARRHAAAHAARMARMGQPDRARARTIATIAAYSPYDNVAAQALSADPGARRPHRSARDLLGAGEMGRAAARSQDRRSHPVLLKTNMDAGHGGASGRFSRLEEVAFNYAFALEGRRQGRSRSGRVTELLRRNGPRHRIAVGTRRHRLQIGGDRLEVASGRCERFLHHRCHRPRRAYRNPA